MARWLGFVLVGGLLGAQVPVSLAAPPRFARDVLPIFRQHCLKCHGARNRKAELNLQTLTGLLQGGESGEPAIVAGNATASQLLELVSSGKMPPGKPRLTKEQVAVIRSWILGEAAREVAGHDAALTPRQQRARRVGFLLEERCRSCHGRTRREAKLDLRTVGGMLKGGKSGPALVPGKPDESLLIRRIAADEMPPRNIRYKLSIHPITETELALIRAWVADGAKQIPPRPGVIDDDGQLVNSGDRLWWAFQSPVAPTVPNIHRLPSRVTNPIDAFVLARLEKEGLGFSPPADRRTLVRRAWIDLLGLLPPPEEVEAFVGDSRSDAWERLVDRLLANPHYGTRWGQHWLDAAGYADSEGSAAADGIYPLLWKYRDYVVRSVNTDKPYDRFLLEQLAGDELYDYRRLPRMTPEHEDSLVATGFLRTGIDPTTSPETNFLIDRFKVLADTVEIVSSSLMGLTLRCARCHSHKYDPLPQRDYYRFTAIFAAAYSPYEWIKPRDRFLELGGTRDREALKAHNVGIDKQVAMIKAQIAQLTETFRARYRKKPGNADKKVDEKTLAASFPGYKQQSAALQQQIKAANGRKQSIRRVHGISDMREQPDPFFLLRRGEWDKRGRRVLPNVPAVLQQKMRLFQVKKPESGAPSSGARLALARWLTEKRHPLTARVHVNRAWQHHFGRGLVATAEDFGKTGTPPSHPGLLDWLAVDFVEHGWSLKRLHRLVLTSTTWRQESRIRARPAAVDPDNRLLWRMPLRRMDAEALRDSLLAVSGHLNLSLYGSGVGVSRRGDGQVVTSANPAGERRSVFLLHRRSQPVTLLETFDSPRMTTNCIQRRTSNVVSQALFLLHSEFTDRQAARLAVRTITEAGDAAPAQVDRAYRLVLGRGPSEEEHRLAVAFLEQQAAGYGVQARAKQPPRVTSVLGMHASKGITFDLAAVRAAHPGKKLVRFEGVAALGFFHTGDGDAHWYVFVDGKQRAGGHLLNNRFAPVRVDLAEQNRFLTLVTSSNGTMNTDWTFFGNPRLKQEDPAGVLDLADIVGGGDGSGTGTAIGLDPWSGNVLREQTVAKSSRVNEVFPVRERPLIDCVFVPHGSADGKKKISVSTSGLLVTGISTGSGTTHGLIWNGHNRGVSGLKQPEIARQNGALVDLCLVLLNSAEFLYVD